MKQINIETGQVFNNWVIISQAPNNRHNKRMWLCQCGCGKIKTVMQIHLTSGDSKNCGCIRHLKFGSRSYVHGEAKSNKTKTKEYRTWNGMLTRCNNPKHKDFKIYGGRGVKVLFKSFKEFLNCVGRAPSEKHSIDRINPFGNYENGNVRWATLKEQANNTRRNWEKLK